MSTHLSNIGGILVILVCIHSISDLLMQTDNMARRKSNESPWLLVVHSFVYATAFLPVLICSLWGSTSLIISSFLILLLSHGAIDTYAPIWIWIRFFRQPPEIMRDPINGFSLWMSKSYGMTLTNGVDQLLHICFLIPIAAMIYLSSINYAIAKSISLYTIGASVGITFVSVTTILFWNQKNELDDDDRPSMPSQHDIEL